MAVSAAVVSAAAGAGAVYQQRQAIKKADQDAALARQSMADLASAAAAPKPVIPAATDEAIRRGKERSIAAQLRRRGRSSTILTQSEGATGDPLGA